MRMEAWATISPIQIKMIEAEATPLSTAPSSKLFRMETDNVSGRWVYEDRTCCAYTASFGRTCRSPIIGQSERRPWRQDGRIAVQRNTIVKRLLGARVA